MDLLFTLASGLNPETDKYKHVLTSFSNPSIEEPELRYPDIYIYSESPVDNKTNLLINYFSSNKLSSKISAKVQSQAILLINNLTPSIIAEIDLNSIYTSDYGTLIIDWEINDDVFSLEIGSSKAGYFIEIDGKDEIQVDEFSLTKEFNVLLKDLNNFYSK